MHDRTRVQELLEQVLTSGMTPEQVCGDDTEMLAEVRARREECRRLEACLADFFPPKSSHDRTVGPSTSREAAEGREAEDEAYRLPAVPGYEVEAVLGRGGMGIVYRARHLTLRRRVALKMLLSGAYAGRVERARFLREARAVAALQHPHVVQVHDVGEHESRPYFAMELVEGGSLAQSIAGVPQAPEKAAALVQAVAEAIDAAHRAGIIHRDIKPANVLVTADGVPKVGDFGLALHSGDGEEPSLTRSGTRIGTPSYMAPEQASARAGAVGPATDIYSLGAVLYEMLTGRPPFRGGTATETERQVLADDPVPPSRIRAKVPRDLETICLKCLEKDPTRRYATAAALADDLGRFRRGEPIAARPVGRIARAVKWARRRPAAATALATGTCAAAMLLAVVLWVAMDRAATARAVSADLDEAVREQESAEWAKANAALERARLRLGSGGGAKVLRTRIQQVSQDAALVDRLDAIRISHAFNNGDVLKFEDADRAYESAFRQFGFGAGDAPARVVGAKVQRSHILPALIDALYDWSVCAAGKGRVEWLREVAGEADPDPTGWRARALDPGALKSQNDVDALASDPSLDRQSVSLQLLVAEEMTRATWNAWPLLIRTQRAHPNDFWVNQALGDEKMRVENYAEAIRYYQVAAAVRSDAALGHFKLGLALAAGGRPLEAIDEYHDALRVGGDSAVIRANLAVACSLAGRYEEACREFAVAIEPVAQRQVPQAILYESAYAYSLMMAGHDADALKWAGRATSMLPQLAAAPTPARAVFLHAQRWDRILAAWRAWLQTDAGSNPQHWRGYAELAIFSGNMAEYRRACREQLERFGNANDPAICEGIGRACLLGDPPDDVLQAATALVDRTLAGEQQQQTWRYPYFMFSKGLAELRAGRAESARAIMEGPAAAVLEPGPKLVAALAHARLGHARAALATLATGELNFDWSPFRADSREAWMYHALRREAERAILPELSRFLSGEYEPHDDTERLALCGECQFRELYATRARLLRQVITTHPELAVQLRGVAVVPAALAGCGEGKDQPALDEKERERWRAQARAWAREELALAASAEPNQSVASAKAAITSWLAAPELACVRDPAALSRMPSTEQREWTAFWQEARKLVPVTQH